MIRRPNLPAASAATTVPTTAPMAPASCVYSLAKSWDVPSVICSAQLGPHCRAPHVPSNGTPARQAPSTSRRRIVAASAVPIARSAVARDRYIRTGCTNPANAARMPTGVTTARTAHDVTAGDQAAITTAAPAAPPSVASRSRTAQ